MRWLLRASKAWHERGAAGVDGKRAGKRRGRVRWSAARAVVATVVRAVGGIVALGVEEGEALRRWEKVVENVRRGEGV